MTSPVLLPVYEYKPLSGPESIRILLLHPSLELSAPLLCDLVHDDRQEIVADKTGTIYYEAISYAWGSPVFSHEMFCEDGKSRLQITPVVYSLLKRLRKAAKPRRLWIDAICLNQADDREKETQVQLMREIYCQAQKTHIWLGDHFPNASEIFHLLRKLVAVGEKQDITKVDQDQWSTSIGQIPVDLLESFLLLPWFKRRWVLQEAVFGHDITVHCGNTKIPWHDFVSGLSYLQSHRGPGPWLGKQAQHSLTTVLALQDKHATILSLLWDHHTAECSDPRDRIFALFGLAFDRRLINYSLNYHDSWIDVFCQFTYRCIEVGRLAHIEQHLHAFGSLFNSDASLPSWVPDWRNSRHHLHPSNLDNSNLSSKYFDVRHHPATLLLTRSLSKTITRIDTVRRCYGKFASHCGTSTVRVLLDKFLLSIPFSFFSQEYGTETALRVFEAKLASEGRLVSDSLDWFFNGIFSTDDLSRMVQEVQQANNQVANEDSTYIHGNFEGKQQIPGVDYPKDHVYYLFQLEVDPDQVWIGPSNVQPGDILGLLGIPTEWGLNKLSDAWILRPELTGLTKNLSESFRPKCHCELSLSCKHHLEEAGLMYSNPASESISPQAFRIIGVSGPLANYIDHQKFEQIRAVLI